MQTTIKQSAQQDKYYIINTLEKTLQKHYTGIITALQYLGVQNANHSLEGITTIAYKHFFSFTLTSALKRLDYNRANRIYTHTTIIDVIKTTLNFYTGRIHKEIDFSHLHSFYDTKELITQYNESDLAFITRIAHNNGIYFYDFVGICYNSY